MFHTPSRTVKLKPSQTKVCRISTETHPTHYPRIVIPPQLRQTFFRQPIPTFQNLGILYHESLPDNPYPADFQTATARPNMPNAHNPPPKRHRVHHQLMVPLQRLLLRRKPAMDVRHGHVKLVGVNAVNKVQKVKPPLYNKLSIRLLQNHLHLQLPLCRVVQDLLQRRVLQQKQVSHRRVLAVRRNQLPPHH